MIDPFDPYTKSSATSKVVVLAALHKHDGLADASLKLRACVEEVLQDEPKAVIFTELVLDDVLVQSMLVSRAYPFPMVLAPNSQNLSTLVSSLFPEVVNTHIMGLMIATVGNQKTETLQKIELPEIQVIHASLAPPSIKSSKKSTQSKEALATKSVLLSAGMDGLGVTPSFEYVDTSGAAVVAEVHKALSLYNASSAAFALHSILSTHARWNYVGTRRWMSKHTETSGLPLAEVFDFSLSIDSLMPPVRAPGSCGGGKATLYVHSAAPIELEPAAERGLGKFCALLVSEAAAANVNLQFVSKRVNVSHFDLRFEHEVFAHKKVPAITISTHYEPQAPEQVLRHTYCRRLPLSPLLDHATFSAASIIHESLSKYFGITKDGGEETHTKLSLVALQGLLHAGVHRESHVNSVGNAAPFRALLDKHVRRGVPLTTPALVASQVTTHKFPSSGLPLSIFGPLEQTVEFHVAKTTIAEMLITAAIGTFVIGFAVVMFGVEKTMSMVAPPSPSASGKR